MIEKFTKTEHGTQWIPVKNLSVVWRQSQRELDERWSKQIAETFDPDYFGTITVCKANGNGFFHVIDGQHRSVAIRELFGENECIPCNVFDVDDPKRAAQIFDRINTARKSPDSVSTFKVRVTAGSEIEMAVNAVIKSCGYKVNNNRTDGTIRAVGSCTQSFKLYGPEALRSALKTLADTWERNSDAVDGTLIRGFAFFFHQFGSEIERARLIERIGKKYTPGKLLSAAKAAKEGLVCNSLAEAISYVLQCVYNEGLRGRRLGEKAAS